MEISFVYHLNYWDLYQKKIELLRHTKSWKQQSYEDDRVKAIFDVKIK